MKQFQQRFPFYDIIPDATRGTVTFKVNDDVFTVEELVGLVLKHAGENAARFAGTFAPAVLSRDLNGLKFCFLGRATHQPIHSDCSALFQPVTAKGSAQVR